ncbi:MAG: hypothetical protein JJD96_02335 [Thermoleophilia bacterium]|nr:hypothetical protein [Thermoleophilia bacterium]
MGSTTIDPGESTEVKVTMLMQKGMGGPHLFKVTVPTSDPAGTAEFQVKANYVES